MTLLAAAARASVDLPYASEVAPYAPVTLCDIPPYPPNGNLNTIHPSVVDFGSEWHGYRWWMANTPYPPDADENPSIFGSNDMQTWETPDGLVNPIDPWPGEGTGNNGWYNSDTELFRDDDTLVCAYRETDGTREIVRARTSADGRTWSDEYTLIDTPGAASRLSPGIVKYGPGDYRLWFTSGELWTAPAALGPWVSNGVPSSFGTPSHHSAVVKVGSYLLAAVTTGTGGLRLGHSTLGGPWVMSPVANVAAGVIRIYRATMQPSPKWGWMDIWAGGLLTEGSGTRTAYTRVPLSEFGL